MDDTHRSAALLVATILFVAIALMHSASAQSPTPQTAPAQTSATQSSTSSNSSKSLRAWLADLAKLPFTVYDNLSRVRSGAEPRAGTRLMLFNLMTQQETVLWECGACWSPMPIDGDRIAFVTANGVEMFSITAKRHSVGVKNELPRQSVVEIVQPLSPSRLLVAVRMPADTACPVRLRVGDLDSAALVAASAPDDCLGLLTGYLKPAWLERNRLIGNTNQAVARLVVWPYEPTSLSGRGTGRMLSSKLAEDPNSRFDPVWFGPDRVVYVLSH